MKQQELEDAITTLERLLAEKVLGEDQYQGFLERHPVVFELLGYEEASPHVELPRKEDGPLVPDFIGRKVNKLYDIIEIKTPDEKLLKLTKNREGLYAGMNEYLAQVDVYREYFDEADNRERVKTSCGLDIQKRPDILMIVGRDAAVDHKKLHAVIRRHGAPLHLLTYDMLLSQMRMQYARTFGQIERLVGLSWHALVQVEGIKEVRSKYVWDAGLADAHDRMSIYLDEHDALCCEIIDSHGRSTRLSVPHGTQGFALSKPLYLCCEFGNSDKYSALQVFVDNRLAAKAEFAGGLALSPRIMDGVVTLGGAISPPRLNAKFIISELVVLKDVLEFQERLKMSEYLLGKLH